MEVLVGIESDQAGHNRQERPLPRICGSHCAYGLAFQVGEPADLIFPEDLEAPEVQPG